MSREGTRFTGVELGLEDENALLRASLAEARGRLQAIEEAADARRSDRPAQSPPFRPRSSSGWSARPSAMERPPLWSASISRDWRRSTTRHGRLAGDSVIVHVARLLAGLIRSTDMVARIGGD